MTYSEVFAEGSAKGAGSGGHGGPRAAIKLTPAKGGRFAKAGGQFRGASKLTTKKQRAKNKKRPFSLSSGPAHYPGGKRVAVKKTRRNSGVAFAAAPGTGKKVSTAAQKRAVAKQKQANRVRRERAAMTPAQRRAAADLGRSINSAQKKWKKKNPGHVSMSTWNEANVKLK